MLFYIKKEADHRELITIFNRSINSRKYSFIAVGWTDDEFYRLVIELLLNFKEALTGFENSFTDIL